MKIIDINNIEIQNPDLNSGYLIPDKLFKIHHETIPAIQEEFHYEYKVYPNGGRDRIKVIDIAGIPAVQAWDEYEDVERYIEYTSEQLEEMNKPTLEDRLTAINDELISTQLALCDLYEQLIAITGA